MKNINKAFIEFNKEFQGLTPDGKNPFFKSTYITLDGILQTVRPLLAKHDLAVFQNAFTDNEWICVKTTILHSSGENIESDVMKMKPVKNDPQAIGSCITYMKRYSIGAALGICESVDDDGNAATYGNGSPQSKPVPKQPQRKQEQPTNTVVAPKAVYLNQEGQNYINQLIHQYAEAKNEDVIELMDNMFKSYGISNLNQLTHIQGEELARKLQKKLATN